MEKTQTNKSFFTGIISLSIYLIPYLLIFIAPEQLQKLMSIGAFFIFGGMIVSFIGLYLFILAKKEPWTAKKVVALIINSTGVIFLIGLIVANIYDIFRAFS